MFPVDIPCVTHTEYNSMGAPPAWVYCDTHFGISGLNRPTPRHDDPCRPNGGKNQTGNTLGFRARSFIIGQFVRLDFLIDGKSLVDICQAILV